MDTPECRNTTPMSLGWNSFTASFPIHRRWPLTPFRPWAKSISPIPIRQHLLPSGCILTRRLQSAWCLLTPTIHGTKISRRNISSQRSSGLTKRAAPAPFLRRAAARMPPLCCDFRTAPWNTIFSFAFSNHRKREVDSSDCCTVAIHSWSLRQSTQLRTVQPSQQPLESLVLCEESHPPASSHPLQLVVPFRNPKSLIDRVQPLALNADRF